MEKISPGNWQSVVVSPETVIQKIKPGMSIFLGTAVAEPRTMVRHLMTSDAKNLEDLELIQLVSFGDAVSLKTLQSRNFRLKTFFSGWAADEAIERGRIDVIPSRFVKIPQLFGSLLRPVDVAVVQITPPNAAGFCSLGIAIDVAREALEQASIRVGEINTQIPRTFGDTYVPVSEFDFLVRSTDPPIYFDRWETDDVWDQVAQHVASLIEDESCLAFSIGPLYEALVRPLANKRNLGIHSPFFYGSVDGSDEKRGCQQSAQGNVSWGIADLLCLWYAKVDEMAGQQSPGRVPANRQGLQPVDNWSQSAICHDSGGQKGGFVRPHRTLHWQRQCSLRSCRGNGFFEWC